VSLADSEKPRAKRAAPRRTPARGAAEPVPSTAAASTGAIDLDRLLDEIFAAIPETPTTNGERGAAEIVRKNRRARARQRIRDAFEARGPYPIPVERRSEARTLVERWAQKGFVDAYPDADTFEERCASERAVLEAAARGDETERFAAAERAYREDVVRRHGFIEIRGLQLSARVYQALDMVYVPLHVEERAEAAAAAKHVDPTASSGVETLVDRAKKSVRRVAAETPSGGPAARKKGRGEGSPKAAKVGADGGRSTAKTGAAAKGNKVSARGALAKQGPGKDATAATTPNVDAIASVLRSIERSRVPVMRALQSHNRLFLLGGPGSGKSTLMAYLAVRAARGDLREETGWKADPIPFLIPARIFREGPVAAEDLARAAGAEPWFLEHALSHRPVLILVDGLDEAKPEMASLVLDAVTSLLDAHSTARAVINARPSGSPTGEEPIPPGFSSARLTPMTPDEVGTFVDRWCLAAEVSLGKSKAVAESDARAAAEDLKERIRARGAIEKLAQTPLLCSVICVVHRFLGQRIPARRVALYEAITNVLLYEWDRAKFPETPDSPLAQLDAQAKRALLSRLARAMHEEQATEWTVERVIASFAKQLPDLGRPAKEAAQLVAHIRDRHGVLVERSPGMFAFSHLTFQEYLTAMEMVARREYELLLSRYSDRWWHECLEIAMEVSVELQEIVARRMNALLVPTPTAATAPVSASPSRRAARSG